MKNIDDLITFLKKQKYCIKQIKFNNEIKYIAFKTNRINRWLLIHICNNDFMKSINRNFEYCCISNNGIIWSYNAVKSINEKSINDYINIMIDEAANNKFCKERSYISDDNEYNNLLFEYFICNGYNIS